MPETVLLTRPQAYALSDMWWSDLECSMEDVSEASLHATAAAHLDDAIAAAEASQSETVEVVVDEPVRWMIAERLRGDIGWYRANPVPQDQQQGERVWVRFEKDLRRPYAAQQRDTLAALEALECFEVAA